MLELSWIAVSGLARLVICNPEPEAEGVTATESITASAPVWFGVKIVARGSNEAGTLLADRIGAIAASRVASAVVMADDVIADALPARVAGLPDAVMRAATAVVSGVTFAVTKTLAFRVEDHTFWRQNIGDGLYNSAGALLRGANGSDAPYIGNEIDLLLTWQVDRHLTASLGYSHFFTGAFIDQTGPDQDIDFLYAGVNYVF